MCSPKSNTIGENIVRGTTVRERYKELSKFANF